MTHEMILQRLTDIFRDVLEDPSFELNPGMTAEDVKGWDSVNHIHIVIATESQFGIRFQTSEIQGLQNVGALVDIIDRKSVGR